MRIQSGIQKGRAIHPKVGARTRPTTARVRKAIFDTLYGKFDLEGAHVVDLFAGTGSLGFEAASRGAKKVTFVESDPVTVINLHRSVASLAREGGCEFKVIRRDALVYLGGATATAADICFCDPPYDFDSWDRLLSSINARFLVAESNREIPANQRWRQTTLKRYGDTVVTFLVPQQKNTELLSREDGV